MALPKDMRLKGHRTFNYIHKNSITYHGKLMTFKVARSNPSILLSHKFKSTSNNFRVAIAILNLFELFLKLCDKRIAGFDLATLKVMNFPWNFLEFLCM